MHIALAPLVHHRCTKGTLSKPLYFNLRCGGRAAVPLRTAAWPHKLLEGEQKHA